MQVSAIINIILNIELFVYIHNEYKYSFWRVRGWTIQVKIKQVIINYVMIMTVTLENPNSKIWGMLAKFKGQVSQLLTRKWWIVVILKDRVRKGA